MGLVNTPQQEIVMGTSSPHLCAIWGRRTGKTTTVLMHAAMAALEEPNLSIQIVPAVAYNRYMPNLIEIINDLENKGVPIKKFITRINKNNQPRGLTLANGSTITITRDLCGKQPDIIYLDDADDLKDDIITVVNSLMDTYDASVFAFGTPCPGKKVHFWEKLHYEPDWKRYYLHCTSYQAPSATLENMERIKKDYESIPEAYECEIMAMKDTLCPVETVDKDIV